MSARFELDGDSTQEGTAQLSKAAARRSRSRHLNWVLLDQALVSGTNFLVSILLVRYLGLEVYGKYVLLWMLVQFVMSIQNAVIVSPMLSVAPKIQPEARNEYYNSALTIQVCFAAAVALIAALAAFLPLPFKPEWISAELMLPVLGCLVFMQFQDFIRRSLFCRLSSGRAFCLDIIAYGAQLPFIFLVIRTDPSLTNAFFVVFASMATSTAIGYRFLGYSLPTKEQVKKTFGRNWVSSKWLLGDALLNWLSSNYLLIVAGAMLGPATVGAIKAAQNLLGLTHIAFLALENVVPAEASRRYQEKGVAGLLSYILRLGFILLAATGIVATVAAVFSEEIFSLIYGEVDPSSVTAMVWFVPIYILTAIVLPLRSGLRSMERTRGVFIAQLSSAAFAVLTAGYLIREFGLHGVMGGLLMISGLTTVVLITSLGRTMWIQSHREQPHVGK